MSLRRPGLTTGVGGLEDVDLDQKRSAVVDLEGGGSPSQSSPLPMTVHFPKEKDFHGVPMVVKAAIAGFFGLTALMALGVPGYRGPLLLTTVLGFVAVAISHQLTVWVMAKDDGTENMHQVAAAVRKGAEGFFSTQYGTIFRMSLAVAAILGVGYMFRPAEYDDANSDTAISTVGMALVVAMSFLFGALFSALAGYTGLFICVRANIRVAAAAKKDFRETMQVAMVSGAIPALIVVGLAISGIVFLFSLLHIVFGHEDRQPQEIPLLMVGFGFGASFVALFAQLGGGIFTKAADVGADLVGKVEAHLDEDDPRNPAVVADLVGDNVGDCAGRGADLFESISAEIIAAMVLGGSIAGQAALPASGFILFPVLIHGFDLVVSALGLAFAFKLPESMYRSHNPLRILKAGYLCAIGLAAIGFFIACKLLLSFPEEAPKASTNFFFCGLLGMGSALLTLYITQYVAAFLRVARLPLILMFCVQLYCERRGSLVIVMGLSGDCGSVNPQSMNKCASLRLIAPPAVVD